MAAPATVLGCIVRPIMIAGSLATVLARILLVIIRGKPVRTPNAGGNIDRPIAVYQTIVERVSPRLRHFQAFNRRVYLYLLPKSIRCPHCNDRPTTTRLDDRHYGRPGMTRAFAENLLLEIKTSKAH